MHDKKEEMNKLRNEIKSCVKCINDTERSMVNVIADEHEFAPKGIGYWNDAFQNYDAKLMIIGQDWGNIEYLDAFLKTSGGNLPEPYREDENPTWENLMHYLSEAGFNTDGGEYNFTDIYLTNALLCLRKGKMTGNDSIENKWFNNCFPFLLKQIDIIKPKVIATLGEKVFRQFGIKYKKFKDVVCKKYDINNDVILFPLYHTGYYGTLNRGEMNKEKGRLNMIDDFKKLTACLNKEKGN